MNTTSNQHSVPVTWSEGEPSYREAAEYGLGIVKDEVDDLMAVKASVTIAEEFAALATLLARVALMLGPDSCAGVLPKVQGLFARARDEFSQGITKHNCVSAIGILNYANLAQCCGAAVEFSDADMKDWLAALVPHVKVLTELECETLALGSLAFDQLDWALVYLDDQAEVDFVPGRVFGANTHGMKLYLLAARQHQAATQAIAPAWEDCLSAFPRKLAAGTMTWSDLIWFGRIFYSGFSRSDVSQVCASLHGRLRELAQ